MEITEELLEVARADSLESALLPLRQSYCHL